MGRKLAEASTVARLVFEEVDDALSQRLSRLMFDGPGEELTLTENAQPALMAVSLAIIRTLDEAGLALADKARFVAGHSLGEYSALCAAGAFTLADTARLLKARGRAMQAAVPVGEGAMAALLGATLEQAEEAVEAAADGEVCAIANDNATGQVVISGHAGAIDRAIAAAQEIGRAAGHEAAGQRAVPLRPHAAGGRCDGGSAGARAAGHARRAADRQRHRGGGQ